MIEFFETMQFWHWIILAIVLIALEILGATGFLLGTVMAAFELALISYIWPDLSWQKQLGLFAVLSIACSVWFWYRFKSFSQDTDHPKLNDRAAQLIGRVCSNTANDRRPRQNASRRYPMACRV